MSRADGISLAVTLFAAGIGWFVGGQKIAIVCLAVGIVLFILVHLFWPKEKVPDKDKPVVKESFNPTVTQTANPTINVNVGQTQGPTAPPLPPEPERSKPNIVCLGARPVNLIFGAYQGASFHEVQERERAEMVGVVVSFRNEPIWGKQVKPIHGARAHLKFFDSSGLEMGTGVSRACWLGHKYDLFDLIPGGEVGSVIALFLHNGKFIVPKKRRTRSGFGEGLVDDHLELQQLAHMIEVSVLDANDQLLLAPIAVEIGFSNGELQASIKSP